VKEMMAGAQMTALLVEVQVSLQQAPSPGREELQLPVLVAGFQAAQVPVRPGQGQAAYAHPDLNPVFLPDGLPDHHLRVRRCYFANPEVVLEGYDLQSITFPSAFLQLLRHPELSGRAQ